MKWNNGAEQIKFKREQKRLRKRYNGGAETQSKTGSTKEYRSGYAAKRIIGLGSREQYRKRKEEMSEIICSDAMAGLKTLPSENVRMCVTSPPYYGLRDYGTDGQIGIEQTPQEYIARLVEVFAEVHRVLTEDGTLWVNISDSYAGSGKGPMSIQVAGNGKNRNLYNMKSRIYEVPKKWEKIKPKDMIGIPWMLAFALRDFGYYLRSDIIWHKTTCLRKA